MSDNRNSSYEMAVNLNNVTAMTVFEGRIGGVGSYYPAACHTIKNAIRLIKTIISNDYVNTNVPITTTTTTPCPMSSSYQDSNVATTTTTTTTSNTLHPMVTVNVISNCSPCPNLMLQSTIHPPPPAEDSTTSRFMSTTTTPIDEEGSQQQRVGSMPNVSLIGPGTVPVVETRGWLVYPMRIEDYDSTIISGQQQHPRQVEYHATVMLYNFAIVNLVAGLTTTTMTDQSTLVLPITSSSSTSMGCGTTTGGSCNNNIETTSSLTIVVQNAFNIFHIALSHLNLMVDPYLQYIADFIRQQQRDDDDSGIIATTTGWNRSSDNTTDDLFRKCIILMILIHYHIIMYTWHFQSWSDNNNNNNNQQQQYNYEYHRSMLNQLASILSYIELFVVGSGGSGSGASIPTTESSSSVTSTTTSNNNNNPIQCTSPAA